MKWRKSAVYDVLHKTSVSFVMAFSAVLMGYIGYSTVHWFTGMDYAACIIISNQMSALWHTKWTCHH